MHLYTNGCSMTYGPIGGGSLQQLDRTWPVCLGENLDASRVTNDAAGCGSNERILRTTIDWISKHPNPKDLFVVIQWTLVTRREFWSNSREDWLRLSHTSHEWYAVDQLERDMMESFYKHWCNNVESLTRTLTYIIAVQSFLKTKQIPYFFFHGFSLPIDTSWVDNPLWEQLDQSRFLWGDPKTAFDSMYNFMRRNRPDTMMDCGHPTEEGYKFWADFLATKIQKVM